MQPLLFLTVRTFINSFRRSLTSPKRLIGILFFLGYYWLVVVRALMSVSTGKFSNIPSVPSLELPPIELIGAGVFLVFGSIMLIQTVALGNKNVFRQADVDVLFPTPIPPQAVLMFRIFRDTLVSIFLPLLITLLTWRPLGPFVKQVFHNAPEQAGYVFKVATVTFLCVAFAWTCLDHAASIFIYRNDPAKRNNLWLTIFQLAFLGTVIGRVWWIVLQHDPKTSWVFVGKDPVLHGMLFLSDAASKAALAPLAGNWVMFGQGLAVILATAVVGLVLCQRQIGYLYDMATIRTAVYEKVRQSMVANQTQGMAASVINKAKEGKVKKIRGKWLAAKTVQGPRALVWKNLIYMFRQGALAMFLFPAIAVFYDIVFLQISLPSIKLLGSFAFGIQMFAAMPLTGMSFTNGLLRNVDVIKPLPFKGRALIFWETASAVGAGLIASLPSALFMILMRPHLFVYILCGVWAGLVSVILMTNNSLLANLLSPDFDDPTQRAFRGFVTVIGMAIVMTPPVLALVGVMFLMRATPLACFLGTTCMTLVGAGVQYLLGLFSARLYAEFNPTD